MLNYVVIIEFLCKKADIPRSMENRKVESDGIAMSVLVRKRWKEQTNVCQLGQAKSQKVCPTYYL